MKITYIELHNFMCFENTSLRIPNDKVLSIYGIDSDRQTSNGIGKSALKEAILFALFGKSKVNLSDLIMKGKQKCKVILEFIEKGNNVRIVREYSNSTLLDIFVNNKKQELKSVVDKNKFIQDLIGCDYDTFVNFSIFDSIRFEDLSELSSSEIKKLFRTLFNYEKFESIINDLKLKVKSIDKSIELSKSPIKHYYSQKRYSILLDGIKRLSEEVTHRRQLLDQQNKNKEECIRKMSELETIINKNNKMISWLIGKSECPTCKRPLDNKVKLLNEYQSELNECKNQLLNLQVQLNNLQQTLTKEQEVIRTIEYRINKLKMLLHNLELQKKYTQNLEILEQNKRMYTTLSQLMDKFSLFVLEHYVHYIENLMNKYLEQLTDIRCNISFSDESGLVSRNLAKIYITLSRDGKRFNYMQLSSGERLLVAYAFKVAINTLSFKDTFLFVDEGLGKLDINNRQKVCKLFEISPFNQVFIVSHDPLTINTKHIYINKINNISSLSIV